MIYTFCCLHFSDNSTASLARVSSSKFASGSSKSIMLFASKEFMLRASAKEIVAYCPPDSPAICGPKSVSMNSLSPCKRSEPYFPDRKLKKCEKCPATIVKLFYNSELCLASRSLSNAQIFCSASSNSLS